MTTGTSDRPNLFEYATSELSQDAFICWFIDCANPDYTGVDPALRDRALAFINYILHRKGLDCDTLERLEVLRQRHNIDILVRLQTGNHGLVCILIEDKTHTSQGDGQIARYCEAVRKEYGDTPVHIVPVYVKTGHMTSYDYVDPAYVSLDRVQLIELLTSGQEVTSDILADFVRRLLSWEARFQAFATTPVREWTGDQWCGFYDCLRKRLDDVAGWEHIDYRGHRFWGLHWHWRVVPESPAHPRVHLYLQLECDKQKNWAGSPAVNELCFKAMLDDHRVMGRDHMWLCHGAVMQAAGAAGAGRVAKRPSAKCAKFTTVAYWPDFMATDDASGLVDIEATLAHLRTAEKILETAVRQLAGELTS